MNASHIVPPMRPAIVSPEQRESTISALSAFSATLPPVSEI